MLKADNSLLRRKIEDGKTNQHQAFDDFDSVHQITVRAISNNNVDPSRASSERIQSLMNELQQEINKQGGG
jgi:hypothetical protein